LPEEQQTIFKPIRF